MEIRKGFLQDEVQQREQLPKKNNTEYSVDHKVASMGSQFFQNKIACEWLSTEEAAHFLRISSNALRILVYRGRVPVHRFGRRLRFRLEDCRALFNSKGA
jgi:excisionase family DNA binding protein